MYPWTITTTNEDFIKRPALSGEALREKYLEAVKNGQALIASSWETEPMYNNDEGYITHNRVELSKVLNDIFLLKYQCVYTSSKLLSTDEVMHGSMVMALLALLHDTSLKTIRTKLQQLLTVTYDNFHKNESGTLLSLLLVDPKERNWYTADLLSSGGTELLNLYQWLEMHSRIQPMRHKRRARPSKNPYKHVAFVYIILKWIDLSNNLLAWPLSSFEEIKKYYNDWKCLFNYCDDVNMSFGPAFALHMWEKYSKDELPTAVTYKHVLPYVTNIEGLDVATGVPMLSLNCYFFQSFVKDDNIDKIQMMDVGNAVFSNFWPHKHLAELDQVFKTTNKTFSLEKNIELKSSMTLREYIKQPHLPLIARVTYFLECGIFHQAASIGEQIENCQFFDEDVDWGVYSEIFCFFLEDDRVLLQKSTIEREGSHLCHLLPHMSSRGIQNFICNYQQILSDIQNMLSEAEMLYWRHECHRCILWWHVSRHNHESLASLRSIYTLVPQRDRTEYKAWFDNEMNRSNFMPPSLPVNEYGEPSYVGVFKRDSKIREQHADLLLSFQDTEANSHAINDENNERVEVLEQEEIIVLDSSEDIDNEGVEDVPDDYDQEMLDDEEPIRGVADDNGSDLYSGDAVDEVESKSYDTSHDELTNEVEDNKKDDLYSDESINEDGVGRKVEVYSDESVDKADDSKKDDSHNDGYISKIDDNRTDDLYSDGNSNKDQSKTSYGSMLQKQSDSSTAQNLEKGVINDLEGTEDGNDSVVVDGDFKNAPIDVDMLDDDDDDDGNDDSSMAKSHSSQEQSSVVGDRQSLSDHSSNSALESKQVGSVGAGNQSSDDSMTASSAEVIEVEDVESDDDTVSTVNITTNASEDVKETSAKDNYDVTEIAADRGYDAGESQCHSEEEDDEEIVEIAQSSSQDKADNLEYTNDKHNSIAIQERITDDVDPGYDAEDSQAAEDEVIESYKTTKTHTKDHFDHGYDAESSQCHTEEEDGSTKEPNLKTRVGLEAPIGTNVRSSGASDVDETTDNGYYADDNLEHVEKVADEVLEKPSTQNELDQLTTLKTIENAIPFGDLQKGVEHSPVHSDPGYDAEESQCHTDDDNDKMHNTNASDAQSTGDIVDSTKVTSQSPEKPSSASSKAESDTTAHVDNNSVVSELASVGPTKVDDRIDMGAKDDMNLDLEKQPSTPSRSESDTNLENSLIVSNTASIAPTKTGETEGLDEGIKANQSFEDPQSTPKKSKPSRDFDSMVVLDIDMIESTSPYKEDEANESFRRMFSVPPMPNIDDNKSYVIDVDLVEPTKIQVANEINRSIDKPPSISIQSQFNADTNRNSVMSGVILAEQTKTELSNIDNETNKSIEKSLSISTELKSDTDSYNGSAVSDFVLVRTARIKEPNAENKTGRSSERSLSTSTKSDDDSDNSSVMSDVDLEKTTRTEEIIVESMTNRSVEKQESTQVESEVNLYNDLVMSDVVMDKTTNTEGPISNDEINSNPEKLPSTHSESEVDYDNDASVSGLDSVELPKIEETKKLDLNNEVKRISDKLPNTATSEIESYNDSETSNAVPDKTNHTEKTNANNETNDVPKNSLDTQPESKFDLDSDLVVLDLASVEPKEAEETKKTDLNDKMNRSLKIPSNADVDLDSNSVTLGLASAEPAKVEEMVGPNAKDETNRSPEKLPITPTKSEIASSVESKALVTRTVVTRSRQSAKKVDTQLELLAVLEETPAERNIGTSQHVEETDEESIASRLRPRKSAMNTSSVKTRRSIAEDNLTNRLRKRKAVPESPDSATRSKRTSSVASSISKIKQPSPAASTTTINRRASATASSAIKSKRPSSAPAPSSATKRAKPSPAASTGTTSKKSSSANVTGTTRKKPSSANSTVSENRRSTRLRSTMNK